MGLLSRDERRNLIEMLLKLPNIVDAQTRRSLVQSLPPAIQHGISHSASARTDIETIIASADAESAQQADGTWPIVLVIEDAIRLVAGSMLASRLQQLLDALRTRAPASSGSGQLDNQAEALPTFYTTSSSPVPTSWSVDLDYVDWCSVVLSKCIEARAMSSNARTLGVDGKHVLRLLFGEEMASRPDFWESPPHRAMIGAIEELKRNSLLEDGSARHFWKVTQMGLWAVKNMRSFWNSLYLPLEPDQEQVLRHVNRLSPHTTNSVKVSRSQLSHQDAKKVRMVNSVQINSQRRCSRTDALSASHNADNPYCSHLVRANGTECGAGRSQSLFNKNAAADLSGIVFI